MRYRIALHLSEEGYSASVPGLPGCWSQQDQRGQGRVFRRIAWMTYRPPCSALWREKSEPGPCTCANVEFVLASITQPNEPLHRTCYRWLRLLPTAGGWRRWAS